VADDLTATLDQIRDDATADIQTHPDEDCPDALNSCLAHNALRAVAAVEAVLAKADEWDAVDPGHPCAAMIREAIAAKLAEEATP